jgi:hypothetical protein
MLVNCLAPSLEEGELVESDFGMREYSDVLLLNPVAALSNSRDMSRTGSERWRVEVEGEGEGEGEEGEESRLSYNGRSETLSAQESS